MSFRSISLKNTNRGNLVREVIIVIVIVIAFYFCLHLDSQFRKRNASKKSLNFGAEIIGRESFCF